jgi:hypothetical protein
MADVEVLEPVAHGRLRAPEHEGKALAAKRDDGAERRPLGGA